MSKNLPQKRREPPLSAKQSLQMDFFTSFYGDSQDLSNTIELWDAIPKYSVSSREQTKMRDKEGNLKPYKQEFCYRPTYGINPDTVTCKITIQAASIENKDGTFTDYYPSSDEELIEEVLKKIFSDQKTFGGLGMHKPEAEESWVRFNLYMIQQELKKRGKARSIDEIKKSVEILAKAVLDVGLSRAMRGGRLYTGTILSHMARKTREDYLIDPKEMWVAQLPALISQSINEISYRQFNYGSWMSLKTPLARWFHKRLSHNFIQAGKYQTYTIKQSTIERDSGLVKHPRNDRRIEYVRDVLEELVEAKVLDHFELEPEKQGRKTIDVKYHLRPTMEFAEEARKANARNRDHRKQLT